MCQKGDLKIDHDANLIDIEGDPLEDFKMKLNENRIDHSSCTLAWTENWEDTAEDSIELDKVLNKKCLRSGNHYQKSERHTQMSFFSRDFIIYQEVILQE